MVDPTSFENRVVVLTGAAGGIGFAMVEGFLNAGARVAAFDVSDAALDRLRVALGSDRLLTHALDVSREAECGAGIERVLNEHGRVDALINLAGITGEQPQEGPFPRFWERDPANWSAVQAINHGGAFNMAWHAVKPMRAQGYGRLINISTSFVTMVNAGMAAYGPSKAAIDASTAIWAKELEGSGVTANVLISGGPVDTPSVPASWPRDDLLPPSVMVPPVLWLASEESAEISGKRFVARAWDVARCGREQAVDAPLAGWVPA